MDVTPLVKDGAQIIQSYAHGGFRVSGQVYDGAIIVFQDKTINWGVSKNVKDLSEDDFSALTEKADDIDVILLGTGKTLIFPEPALKKQLKDLSLHIESMDSGAACRTYNVLMAEGRRVVAALLPL